MTITTESRRTGPFQGDGITTVFPFEFRVFERQQVVVIRTDLGDVESTLVINTDFTVFLNSDQSDHPGGTVTLLSPLAVGYKLTLTSNIPNLQPTNFKNLGSFNPEVMNESLDRATIQIQQVDEKISRAVTVPISSDRDPSSVFDDFYSAINDAQDAAGRAETAADIAEDAAVRADQVLNLSISVEEAPTGETTSGSFDPDTGMLTLRVPQGPEGPAGANGVVVEISGLYAFEIRGDNLFMIYDEGGTPPDISINVDGDLIWRG